jgi:hypothetical protein
MVRSLMAGSPRMRVEGSTLGRGGAGVHERGAGSDDRYRKWVGQLCGE